MYDSMGVGLLGSGRLLESCLWGLNLVLGLSGFLLCNNHEAGRLCYRLCCHNVLPGLRPKAMDPANLTMSPLKLRANINPSCLGCLGQLFCPSDGNLCIAHLIWCHEPGMHWLPCLISPTECYILSGHDLSWISRYHPPWQTTYWWCSLKEEMKANEKVIYISSWWFDSIWLMWREPSEAVKSET